MPSVDTFLEQDNEYRESVLPSKIRQRVSVEAGHTDYWSKFVGLDGVTRRNQSIWCLGPWSRCNGRSWNERGIRRPCHTGP